MIKAFKSVFGLVADTADVARLTVDNANHYVREHTKANKKIITSNAQMRLAQAIHEHNTNLESDTKLKTIYENVAKDWNDDVEDTKEEG